MSGPVLYARHSSLPVFFIERGDPAVHAHLAARIADVHAPLGNGGRHGHGLAAVDIAELRAPYRLAGLYVERNGLAVERVEDVLAVDQPCRRD